jgi:hypothetical protein
MAGGPYANVVPCSHCERQGVLEPAERTYEGSENDVYRCARGHTFAIHWRQIPERPLFERPSPVAERPSSERPSPVVERPSSEGPSSIADRPPSERPSPMAERERIAVAAYYRYLARCEAKAAGDALGDWLAAEQALPASPR